MTSDAFRHVLSCATFCAIVPLTAAFGCATTDAPEGAAGSAGSMAGGGSAGSGGSAGAGGSQAQAGQGGSGGALAGNGGAGGATAGSAGSAGSMAGGGAGGQAGGGGQASCDGNAVFFNANTGDGNDPAKARVEIDFGQSTDLPTGNENRTIEFWAYVLTTSWAGDKNTMFFYGTNKRVADGFGLDFGGVKGTIDPFTNAIFDNDDQPSGLDPSKDQWAHFAMTWDGTAVRAFVNGVQKAMKTSSEAQKTLMTGRTAFIVGSYPSNYFNGKIDELRIWNVAHSAAEIAATMNHTLVGNETGLTGYWKFDEKSGTTAVDSVTSAGHMPHNGTLMADSPADLPTFVAGPPLMCP